MDWVSHRLLTARRPGLRSGRTTNRKIATRDIVWFGDTFTGVPGGRFPATRSSLRPQLGRPGPGDLRSPLRNRDGLFEAHPALGSCGLFQLRRQTVEVRRGVLGLQVAGMSLVSWPAATRHRGAIANDAPSRPSTTRVRSRCGGVEREPQPKPRVPWHASARCRGRGACVRGRGRPR